MKLKKRLKLSVKSYSYLKKQPENIFPLGKSVFLDFDRHDYTINYYTFIKFFLIEGYNIILSKKVSLVVNMINDLYAKEVLNEANVYFLKRKHIKKDIKTIKIKPYYFQDIRLSSKEMVFPICMHPEMYYNQLWVESYDILKEKKSSFMIGNFNSTAYGKINDRNFDILNRNKILEILSEKDLSISFKSIDEIKKYIHGNDDGKCIVIDRREVSIRIENLRKTFTPFYFFLAFPGTIFPLCHNIIEAMSCGCIPILQESYAKYMFPNLVNGKNAIIFENELDLESKVKMAFSLGDDSLNQLTKGVEEYYKENLTPEGVINNIMNGNINEVYIVCNRLVDKLRG